MNINEIVVVEEVRAKSKHPCPAGTHNAVCAAIYDLGIQKSAQGWPDRRKLAFIFEVEEKIAEGPLAGQPYRVSKIVSATLNDKSALTVLLTSWLGHDPRKAVNGKIAVTMSSLIGKPCMLTVTQKTTPDGDVQPVVAGISAHMKGLPAVISTFDATKVPEWIAKKQAQRIDPPDQVDEAVPQQVATDTEQEPAENPPLVVEEPATSVDITSDWLSA